jgi:hypothetical protein
MVHFLIVKFEQGEASAVFFALVALQSVRLCEKAN